MTAKREKVHFESVEELLGAPVAKDATSEIRIDQIFPFENHPFKVLDDDCSCQYWFDRMMREPMR